MAKDRARNPKRVPVLGISDPISHVKVRDVSQRYSEEGVDEVGMGKDRPRYDASGKTDFERTLASSVKESKIAFNTNAKRTGKPGTEYYKSDVPVVKIRS